MTENTSPAQDTVASGNWKPLALITICAVAVYGIAGSFVPEVPYLSDEVLIYPLLLLYKDTPFFHIVMVIFAVCIGIWIIIFRLKTLPSQDRPWIAAVLILTVGLIMLTAGKILAPDYRHHDNIEVAGHLYRLGSSSGPGWPALQYLVYRCDQSGLMCELLDVPTSGIDRSQLPSASPADRSASFVISDTGDLLISVDNITYPVSPNSPS